MDYKTWRGELQKDAETLELLTLMVADITPEHAYKLQELLKLISAKIENPITPGNKKVLRCSYAGKNDRDRYIDCNGLYFGRSEPTGL